MDDNIVNMLNQPTQPEKIQLLLNDVRTMVRHSRRAMKKHYSQWDQNMRLFKTVRAPDEEDNNARKNAEPEKMVVPMTYTQVMTFATFAFMLLKQNENFFELDANQNEAYGLTECSEDFLQRDLRYNRWDSKLLQTLLDIARMGICAVKTAWRTDTCLVNVQVPGTTIDTGMGWSQTVPPSTAAKRVTKYEGNEITNISPYRLLPDLRLPLSRWREGRFVADEMEFNIAYLQELEEQGVVAGVKYVAATSRNLFKGTTSAGDSSWDVDRFAGIQDFLASDNSTGNGKEAKQRDFICISTEGQFKIIPSRYGIGPETYPCDYLIQIVNDQRIIRLEKMEYMHQDFIYDIGQFIPDQHSSLSMSLVDPISAVQEVISFLVNTRVISIRQGIEKHVVYDPSVIETSALAQRSPYIPLKKGAPRNGVSNYLMQLKYNDPTSMNMQEADQFSKILQTVTGVNENAMGQYAPGRRSATENRAANQGAASRMTFHTSLLWSDCYGPMGMKMLSNLRQGVSEETFMKVIGKTSPTSGIDLPSLYAQFCPTDHTTLIGDNSFFVFNGTTQSERTFLAQSLQELVVALMSNPEMVPLLGYDVTKLIDEIQFLRGVRNVQRFKRSISPIPAPQAGAPVAGGAVNPVAGSPDVQSQQAMQAIQGGVSGGAPGAA